MPSRPAFATYMFPAWGPMTSCANPPTPSITYALSGQEVSWLRSTFWLKWIMCEHSCARISFIAFGVLYGGAIAFGGVRYRNSPWFDEGQPSDCARSHCVKNATAVWYVSG